MTGRTSSKRRVGSAAAVVTLALGGALAAAAPAGPARAATSAPFQIGNLATYKCLEAADWRTDDGAPVRQWTCTGGDNQKWAWTDANQLVNVHSGKCLEIPGYSGEPGTAVGQWTCNGGANQVWSDASRLHSGLRHLVNAHSGRYLDVAGGSTADGAPVIQWGLNGADNQVWYYSPFPPGPHH
ncbi:RICIN domain-containing protein [Kitasatospora sp. NPDC005748]|uniref:RICIN domain-containing protein n=1 Tax=Kitasatospora sp. NPDC005748 TaxID=3157063 RepID=UPI0033F009C2